jgi:hypothetical protein
MAPRGRKADLGEPVFVLQGKTEHHAFLLKGYPPIIKCGIPHLWIQWGSTDNREPVPEKDVRREVELSGRRSRRATLKVKDEKQEQEQDVRREVEPSGRSSRRVTRNNGDSNGASLKAKDSRASASQPAMEEGNEHECKQKKRAPAPKRSKRQHGVRPRKRAHARKTDGSVASLNTEDRSASSASQPTREDAEVHVASLDAEDSNASSASHVEDSSDSNASQPAREEAEVHELPRGAMPWNRVHATQSAGTRIVASPPRAAPGRVLNIIEGDEVLVKDQGWATAKGYFVLSSPKKGNHPNQIQIRWSGPDGTILDDYDCYNDYVSEDNIQVHIPKNKPEDMEGEVLRLADELLPTVDQRTTTKRTFVYSVLQACGIETEEEDYYEIVEERVRHLLTGRVQP